MVDIGTCGRSEDRVKSLQLIAEHKDQAERALKKAFSSEEEKKIKAELRSIIRAEERFFATW